MDNYLISFIKYYLHYSIEFWYSLNGNNLAETFDTGIFGLTSGQTIQPGQSGFHIVSDMYNFPTPSDKRFCGDIFLVMVVSVSIFLSSCTVKNKSTGCL